MQYRAALVAAALLLLAGAANAAPVTRTFELIPGMLLEACGGFTGECQLVRLEGQLTLTFDTETGHAEVAAAALQTTRTPSGPSSPFPFDDEDLRLEDLVGHVADGAAGQLVVELRSPDGAPQEVAWLLLLSNESLALNGFYDEGCCDRFRFDFQNIAFRHLQPTPAPRLLLGENERFAVEIEWTNFDGDTAPALGTSMTADTGFFFFFSPDNVEITVKILDGCSRNGHYWVFAAGMTTVGAEMRVTDLETGQDLTFFNPVGTSFAPISDIRAFACSSEN